MVTLRTLPRIQPGGAIARRGLSLTELGVTIALTALVLLPLGIVISALVRTQREASGVKQAAESGHLTLTVMERELLQAYTFQLGYKADQPVTSSILYRTVDDPPVTYGLYWDINEESDTYLYLVRETLSTTSTASEAEPRTMSVCPLLDFRLNPQGGDTPRFVSVYLRAAYTLDPEIYRDLETRIYFPNRY